jgi:hypothetical protein
VIANMKATGAQSLFSVGFNKHLIETDVKVRSIIGSIYRPRNGQILS